MSRSIHVCLRVGNGSNSNELGLSLTVSEGSGQVRGLAFLEQEGGTYLEFVCEGKASLLHYNGEDVIHLTLTGSTLIQTGGNIGVEALLAPAYEKGVANWAYRPETGPVQGAKRQPVSRISCPAG